MRSTRFAVFALALACFAPGAIAADNLESVPTPSAVALSQDNDGKWVFKSFPAFQPLYYFEGDSPTGAACDEVCVAVWPIFRAESESKPVGEWKIMKRDDGRLQWVYKNQPVYTYFEDRPSAPQGAGKDVHWYLNDEVYTYLARAGVVRPAPLPIQATAAAGKKSVARLLEP